METFIARINATLTRAVCQGWDRSFLHSILAQLEDGIELTARQREALYRVLDRCADSEEDKHEEWVPLYRTKYQATAVIMAHYHVKEHYFQEIAKTVLEGQVPPRRKFLRMYNNKYSQKVVREYEKDPRLPMGTHVVPRTNFNGFRNVEMNFADDYTRERYTIRRFCKYGAFIVGVEKYVHSAARGAKRYRLLAPGCRHVFVVEERFLKRAGR